MYWPNLKFVAFPVPEIIGGSLPEKKLGSWAIGYAHAPFSVKFFMGFYSDGPRYCSGTTFSPVHQP